MAVRDDSAAEYVLEPIRWVRDTPKVLGAALGRLWGRDVMLYTGGVSFFALLAIFPAVAIMIGLYSLFSDPQQAAIQAEAIGRLMPAGAETLFQGEVVRLVQAPHEAVSVQSIFALVVGAYAAHRGFKALLAGLSFIHDEPKPRGFLGFNILALLVLIAAFALMAASSAVFLTIRLFAETLDFKPLKGLWWIYSEWTWASAGLWLALTLIYRFAMASRPVAWRASAIGGVAATAMLLAASWACAVYVDEIAPLGATYGSLATFIVFLIWLSWNVNAVFFGGALATEVEARLKGPRAR
ncbi:MAG TPA: YihY/virulence factor BrkB family protein [Phenylobacterium sp.]|nr:YihY/virulence factor BrkB family protein [Phenylobacterium sp.]